MDVYTKIRIIYVWCDFIKRECMLIYKPAVFLLGIGALAATYMTSVRQKVTLYTVSIYKIIYVGFWLC